jgi:hypothetical protein
MNTDGGNRIQVTPTATDVYGEAGQVSWHNSGLEIIYFGNRAGYWPGTENVIYIIGIDGSNKRILVNNEDDKDCWPQMNPVNSDELAYHYDSGNWHPNQVFKIRTISTGVDRLVKGNRNRGPVDMQFGHDGTYLVFSEYSETSPGYWELQRLNLSTLAISTVYQSAANESALAAITNDGMVYFSVSNTATNSAVIKRCRPDGSEMKDVQLLPGRQITLTSAR